MKPPNGITMSDLNYIGQSHLLPGMSLHKQQQIFARHGYDCAPKAKPPVWPDEATVEAVLAEIRVVIKSTPIKEATNV